MKHKFKKLVMLLLVFVLMSQNAMFISANDFDERREYYEQLCFNPTAKENATTCNAFQEHINNEVKRARENLNNIRSDISSIRSDILKYTQDIRKYEEDILELERQIEVFDRSIRRMEASITQLIEEIEALEETIKIRDETIQERMIAMQGFFSINGFVEIIMGASNFTDLVRRIEGIRDITYYDNEQIKLMQAEIEKVESDKIELERQRNVLEDNRLNVLSNQETVLEMKTQVENIIVEFRRQEADLVKIEQEAVADLSAVQEQIRLISNALNQIVPSLGWIRPISSGFRISAGAWYYPSGGIHLGVDFAAPIGTPVLAVANGVVIYSADRCPTWGWLGNSCGSPGTNGGGNQVYLLVSVNNQSYAIRYLHFQSGTTARMGSVVNAGDIVGRVGSSGNSSGPHLHIEVIYLGNNNINFYAQNWNGDLSFGTGWYSSGMNRRCSVTGNSPPCRLNPSEVFGVRVFQSY